MKIKGSELIQFVDTAWPEPVDDWYWDHEVFDEANPDATYETDEIGPIQYQGDGDDPTDAKGYDIAALVRKWRKDRDFDLLSVEVPKAATEAVKAAIAAAGGKVR